MFKDLIKDAVKSGKEVEELKKKGDETPIKRVGEGKIEGKEKEGYEDIPEETPKPNPEKENNEKPSDNNPQEKIGFIKWFSELNKDSGKVAGGKGANLAEIYNEKIPVPPGFVVTSYAYEYFIKKAGIKEKIEELLGRIDYEDTEKLDEYTRQIRTFIIESKFPEDLKEEIEESYENLDADKTKFEKGSPLEILKGSKEPLFVAVRSSATTEDLADASFAGQQDTYLNIKGKHDLIKNIKKCFASLFTSRATYYRKKKGFEHSKSKLAIVVQKMVDSDKSGVMFSSDPSYKNDDITIEAVWGLGEGIVSGQITPDRYIYSKDGNLKDKKVSYKKTAITRDSSGNRSVVNLKESRAEAQVLTEYELKKLTDYAIRLEEHYQKPQDIEFAIEGEDIYIVQTRPITTMGSRKEKEEHEIEGKEILSGLAASPGIASGKIRIVESMEDLKRVKKGDVLVTEMTNPDMVVTMQRSSAIVTNEGGLTAHAAIVSREMGIPCVVGTDTATETLKDGNIATVDGFSGKIYEGKTSETVKKEIKPVEAVTKTKIKTIVDLPSFAERASKTNLKSVGLTRMEGIIAESGKHPEYFSKNGKTEDYQEIIFRGIDEISRYFDEIWVRTSDIRSNEYSNLEGAPKEEEENPMLGNHGIRYSIKNPKILQAELKALQEVANRGKKVGILMPQLIRVEELKEVKKVLKEINFNNVKIGVMIETPAAIQIIKDLCEEGIDFISFGTNDLTQYILAIDRGNEEVQELYDEMHPAVLRQMEYVIRVCKRYNVETSICGQAGSKKPMAKYLVEKGIDSISVNADMAAEISQYISEIEKGTLSGTDKEPRHYEMKKREEEMKGNEDEVKLKVPENPEPITDFQESSETKSEIKQESKKDESEKPEADISESSEEENDEDYENKVLKEINPNSEDEDNSKEKLDIY